MLFSGFRSPLNEDFIMLSRCGSVTLYRMVTPIGTPFLKEKINN